MTLHDVIERLRDIDFGYVEGADDAERERVLRELESVVDDLELVLELDFPEADAAIQHLLTAPELARTYVYGPTDLGDGTGLLDQLIELLHETE